MKVYFEQLFADTDVTPLPDDQKIIVYEPKYYEQLNTILGSNSSIFTKEGLGNSMSNIRTPVDKNVLLWSICLKSILLQHTFFHFSKLYVSKGGHIFGRSRTNGIERPIICFRIKTIGCFFPPSQVALVF